MYKVCAACLHWGNAKFKQRPREEQAEVADPKGLCRNYACIQANYKKIDWHIVIARSELMPIVLH